MATALSYHHILLYEEDVETLKDGRWINDKIISFFFEYLRQTILANTENTGILLIDASVTQLLKLSNDLDSCELLDSIGCRNHCNWLFLAVNDSASRVHSGGTHWSLLLYSPSGDKGPVAYHLDSLSSQGNKEHALDLANKLANYYEQPSLKEFSDPFPVRPQSNGCDCGIYCISFVEVLCEKIAAGDVSWQQCGLVSPDIETIVREKRKVLSKLIGELAMNQS